MLECMEEMIAEIFEIAPDVILSLETTIILALLERANHLFLLSLKCKGIFVFKIIESIGAKMSSSTNCFNLEISTVNTISAGVLAPSDNNLSSNPFFA